MLIRLGITRDANNVVNKVVDYREQHNIVFKRDVDIVRPVIRLVGSGFDQYNYAHIVELNRYYFIREIRNVNSRIMEISLVCDVLSTYSNQLLECSAKYYRSIREGDYVNVDLPRSNISTSKQYMGNVSVGGDRNMILSSIGG